MREFIYAMSYGKIDLKPYRYLALHLRGLTAGCKWERERELQWSAHQISRPCNPYVDPSGPSSYVFRPCSFTRGFRRNFYYSLGHRTRKACYTIGIFHFLARRFDRHSAHNVIRFHASLMTREQNDDTRCCLRLSGRSTAVSRGRPFRKYARCLEHVSARLEYAMDFLSNKDSIKSPVSFNCRHISGKFNIFAL